MLVFAKKRWNKEPSELKVEIAKYGQNYASMVRSDRLMVMNESFIEEESLIEVIDWLERLNHEGYTIKGAIKVLEGELAKLRRDVT